MKDKNVLWLFPEFAPKPKEKKVVIKKNKKTSPLKLGKPKRKKSFSELDVEFWKAQDDFEASHFSLSSPAWAIMWLRVQHAVYNILFRKLYRYRQQDEIESLSYEVAGNVMKGFLKKIKNGKVWKVEAPIAGYCRPFCMIIYAERFKQEDRELSLDDNEENETSYMAVKRTNTGLYKQASESELLTY